MKEVIIDAPRSFIGGWILDDLSICDDLINVLETGNSLPGTIIKDTGETSVIDKTVKDSIDISLNKDDPVANKYGEYLQDVLELYKKKFEFCNHVHTYSIEGINLQKYPPGGGFYQWHTERLSPYEDAYRHLVFMTYLNDVDDAGQTEFFYQQVKIKPIKGLTLFWPADWTHTHRGVTSLTQTKYITTGWYSFNR